MVIWSRRFEVRDYEYDEQECGIVSVRYWSVGL